MTGTEEEKAILKSAGTEGNYQGIGNLISGYDNNGIRLPGALPIRPMEEFYGFFCN